MASETQSASALKCRLFGAFHMEGPGGPIWVRSRRARALVAYLAFAGEAGASRQRLSGLLWSDRGEDQARASLRQCLLELRRELADAGIHALDIGRARVFLDPAAVATDIGELEAAVRLRDHAALAASLRSIGAKPLLEDPSVGGLYDEWLSQTRAQVDSMIEREVRRAIGAAEARGAWDELRGIAEAFLLRQPADELTAAAAIRADMAMGVTSSAHRRFRALESTLAQEYGLRPSSTVSQALTGVQEPPSAQPDQLALPAVALPPPTPAADHFRPIVVVSAFEGSDFNDAARTLAGVVRDEVVSGLSRFRDLSVVTDPHASYSLNDAEFSDPQMVFILGARVRPGQRLGLTVQLLRLHNRGVVWSDSYSIPDEEVLHKTDEIVRQVVGSVLPSIDQDLVRPHREADSASSYARYLRARRRAVAATTYSEALSAEADLKALIEEHPNFVLPYLPLAYLYNTDFSNTLAGSSDEARREEALTLAKKAISIDRGHHHGYVIAAWCYLRQRRWESARQFFDQALNLNAFHPSRLDEIGFGLLFLDEKDRARELLGRCLLVNPTPDDIYFTDLGLLELVFENYELAATYFDLVAKPNLWSQVYQAVNLELSGFGPPDASARARNRILAIWPEGQPKTMPQLVDWVLAHNPFRSKEVEERFVAGARMVLGPACDPPEPGGATHH